MQKHSDLEDEINRIVADMDNQEDQEQDRQTPQDEIQDIYVLIVREREEEEEHSQVVDSTPAVPMQQDSFLSAYLFLCFSLLLIGSTLSFQCFCLFNPLVATVTIIPKSQTVTLSGTLQLGRLLNPITISQSQTTPTTGYGHQPAEQARGNITFYNGQFQSVTIAAGTILTGASNIQVVTDQDATIPAGNPPSYGQTTVSAHAIPTGIKGNIPAYDINQACCATSVLAKNVQSFYGGQDERAFPTVQKSDINNTASPLKTSLAQSMQGALQGQAKPDEQVFILPCSPTVTSDHPIGAEATFVKVTVSQICSAVAYNPQELAAKATAFLSTYALQKLGAGYSLFGTVHVSVTQATIQKQVIVSYDAQGTWVYAIGNMEQQYIKRLIEGKTKQQAVQLLASLPGVERATIRFNGFGDDTRVPKNPANIHLVLFFSA